MDGGRPLRVNFPDNDRDEVLCSDCCVCGCGATVVFVAVGQLLWLWGNCCICGCGVTAACGCGVTAACGCGVTAACGCGVTAACGCGC